MIMIDKMLFHAALNGNYTDVIKYVNLGANVNSQHNSGATPLYAAVADNKASIVKYLIEHGANLNIPTNQGATALYKSAVSCKPKITKILAESGANLEILKDGNSALYAAISSGCAQDVNILLEHGALLSNNNVTTTPFMLAAQERDKDFKHKQIFKNVLNHYWKQLESDLPKINALSDNSKTFEVVIVRYDEDLSWIKHEFINNERITIYNKGKDDLNFNDLPPNTEIISIENIGWFGGTILYHLINRHETLAELTLYLQGMPYDQPVITPLASYKIGFPSKCKNIRAKCVETTLDERSQALATISQKEWAKSKYGGKFELFKNFTLEDFAYKYVSENIIAKDSLAMVWGAQFAVDKENVYLRSKEFFKEIFSLFNQQYPMADFYLEKLWELIFKNEDPTFLLYLAALKGNINDTAKFIAQGADLNSTHSINITPLFAAIAKNHSAVAELLIDSGASPDIGLISGETPAFRASMYCNVKILEKLVKNGAQIDIANNLHQTPLYAAIYSGCTEAVKILVDAGARTHWNETEDTPIRYAKYKANRDPAYEEIFNLVFEGYKKELATLVPRINQKFENSKTFEVVIVRYDEDLSWIKHEFQSNEKITIYNKGKDDLNLNDLPPNTEIISIENIGWFGGTILHHLITRYHSLADKTLFLQGEPYEQPSFLPYAEYKGNIQSTCKGQVITGKGEHTTLKIRSDEFTYGHTEEQWATSKYAGKFKLFKNYSMIDYGYDYINPNISADDPLCVVWGAQFAIDKEKVHLKKKSFFEKIAVLFNEKYPMADFYLEKLWDLIFRSQNNETLNHSLFEAAARGYIRSIEFLLDSWAEINSKYLMGATPLYAATAYNQTEAVNLLIKEGAEVDISTNSGATPLYKASVDCYPEIIKTLLDNGANQNISVDGFSALFRSISSQCTEGVKHFLHRGDIQIFSDVPPHYQFYDPIYLNSFKYNENDASNETKEIYSMVLEYYYNMTAPQVKEIDERTMNNGKTFEVVVVRYKEELSWVAKEFPHDKVTIYNKGPDDIGELPNNCTVIKIENIGYLGGTYIKHIVDNYHQLADLTLFTQGHPYDANVYLPLIRYKIDLDSKCKNIRGKCTETTLRKEWQFLKNANWGASERYKDFVPRDSDMLEFTHKYVGNVPLDEPLYFPVGAIYAVAKEKILQHPLEYYQRMLPEFNYTKPMVDHFAERLPNAIFGYYDEIIM